VKHIFGPVPSRRLGRSLGVDPIPLKTCNLNCVYCQLGRSVPMTHERKVYVPVHELVADVTQALDAHPPGSIDWVTVVGSGEPTLHLELGSILRQVKAATAIPVAVITNGSLLHLPEVRRDLAVADAVLPTLDAGTPALFRKINRPHPEVTLERLGEGLVAFRKEYRGHLWIEVMLIRGLNDTEEALDDLAGWMERIQPDEIHLNLPVRPPAEPWVEPADPAGVARAAARLGQVARVVQPPLPDAFDLSGFENVVDAVVAVITRHPMRQDELVHTLDRWAPDQVEEALAALQASGRAQVVKRHGHPFWTAASTRFG
jgi:wyosine [tRNA(Phe)-imidazoG37] synthetase (radical SAM superfamily)